MGNRHKILHIITDLPFGGAQDNTLYTVEQLDRKKYDVSLACNMSGDLVERAQSIPNLGIYHIPSLQRDLHLLKDMVALFRLIRIIRDGEFDIVHTHSSKPGVLGRIACLFTGTWLVIHTVHGFPFHEFMNPVKRRFYIVVEKIMNLITTHLITVSTLNLKKIIDLKMAPPEKLTNIYSGIDVRKFKMGKALDLHQELEISRDNKILGFIGRLSEQKSPMTFLKALQQVIARQSDIHVIVVGDGPLREEMDAFISENSLSEHITFLGYRDDVNALLKSIDYFVLSSIYEGLGRSVTEALCCQVPIIATAVEGVPELIRHKRTGLLVEAEKPEQLAKAIIYALKHPADMKSYAKTGSRFVEKNFPVEKMVSDIDSLYQELLNKP